MAVVDFWRQDVPGGIGDLRTVDGNNIFVSVETPDDKPVCSIQNFPY